MDLTEDECWDRLASARRVTLGTIHPERGLDLVPAVFAISPDRHLVIPVDTIKPKRSTTLRRLANVGLDPRCCVLADSYDDDWARLWWVRVHGVAEVLPPAALEPARRILAGRYRQYRVAGAIVAVLGVTPTAIVGWAAG